jgi:hypothetical protein
VAAWAGPASADIYGLKSKSLSGNGVYQYEPPVILFRMADNGSGLMSPGYVRTEAGVQLRADALACGPDGSLWFFEPSRPGDPVQSTLHRLNATTAVADNGVAVLTGRSIFGAAFDRSGRLWAMDEVADQLIRVNPATGAVLETVNLTRDGVTFNLQDGGGDMAFDASGRLWLVYGDQFFLVNPTTGAMTLDRTQTGISLWMVGAAFSPLDASHLYVFDVSIGWYNDDLLRFDVDNAYARTDLALRIFDGEFNAGRGDLAVMIPPDTLAIEAEVDWDWVYPNTDVTTGGRHKSVVKVAIQSGSLFGETYTVTLQENHESLTNFRIDPSEENKAMSEVEGVIGTTLDVFGGTRDAVAPGAYSLTVTVTGATWAQMATADVPLTLRLLGDIDGDGLVNSADKLEMNKKLNGLDTLPGITLRALDLSGDGALVNAEDKLAINQVLNGLVVP